MPQCEMIAPSVEAASRGKLARSALWISCGRSCSQIRREAQEGFSPVQIRVVQHAIEQRGENLTYTFSRRDPRDLHHLRAADRQVGDPQRRRAAQLGFEASLDLLLVREAFLDES